MFDRVLVPTDGSERITDAIYIARRLGGRGHPQLVLQRVESARTPRENIQADTRELERRVNDLRAQGVDARYLVDVGRTDESIVDAAREQQVDVIVMVAHQRGGLQALRHPSVTAGTLAQAPAPVLVWPERLPAQAVDNLLAVPGSCVLVPLDGSALSERALPFAIACARQNRRPLLLMRVVPPVPFAGTGDAYRLEVEAQQEEERACGRYLGAVRRRIMDETGLEAQTMVLAGDPQTAIARVADAHEGSLLVMSTHGRGGLARLLIGSVAATMVREASVPLLIVPPHASLPELGRLNLDAAHFSAQHPSSPPPSIC